MGYRCLRYRFKSEVPSISFVRNADLKGRTLIDIGAHRGIYSIYMSRAAGVDGKLVSFEAQPELGEHLKRVKRNFGLENMTIENVGLSAQPGTLKLLRSKAASGGASFNVPPEGDADEIEVPVVRLDDYLDRAAIGPVHFIKCDVEGHESEVFQGARRMLARDLPILLFECDHDQAARGELFGFLTGLGYDGFFYHVDRADHRSWLRKNRGRYVHYPEYAKYPYVRPGLNLRNYLFVAKGLRPESLHYGGRHGAAAD